MHVWQGKNLRLAAPLRLRLKSNTAGGHHSVIFDRKTQVQGLEQPWLPPTTGFHVGRYIPLLRYEDSVIDETFSCFEGISGGDCNGAPSGSQVQNAFCMGILDEETDDRVVFLHRCFSINDNMLVPPANVFQHQKM